MLLKDGRCDRLFLHQEIEQMFPIVQSPDTLEQRRQLQKKRLRHRVQLQSRQIERVMDAHQLPAHVAGGVVAPQVIQFDLQTQLHGGWEWIRSLTDDLRQALGVPQISITRENGRLQVAVARPTEVPVRLLDVMAMSMDVGRETAVLGLSDNGVPVLLPLQAHTLISGIDGAGKTSLLRTISMSLALANRQSQLQQVIIAPVFEHNNAYSDFKPLTALPHMSAHIAFRIEEASQLLAWLVDDMENRLRSGETSPSVILMIDHVVEIMDLGGEPIVEPITALLQRGEKAGIRLVLTTPSPDSDLLDTHLKASLSQRIVGRATDALQALSASGLENSEAEYLLGQGDFLLVQDDKYVYFQAAYMDDYDLHMSLKKLHRNSKVSILAQPYLVRPKLPDYDSEPIPASFWMRNGSIDFFEQED